MPLRYPLALLDPKIRENDLLTYGQKIHDGIEDNPTLYPILDLPITLANLQTSIDDYQSTLAGAVKGSKNSTALKNNDKNALIFNLRILQQYINVAARGGLDLNINTYAIIQANILASGFKVDKTPRPADAGTGLSMPIVQKAISKDPGNLYLVLRNYTSSKRGKRMFQINYRTAASGATPAGQWISYVFSGGNITIQGLTSGKIYDWQVAALSGRNVKLNEAKPENFTVIQQIVII